MISIVNQGPSPRSPSAGHLRTAAADPAIRRVLVASDGKPSSLTALSAAESIAARHGAAVTVLSVFTPPIPYPVASGESTAVPRSDAPSLRDLRSAVRRQVAEGARGEWPVIEAVGYLGPRVAEAAHRQAADLVVAGLGRERPSDRLEGERSAVAIALSSVAPLLAVAAGFSGAPRRILVAVGADARCTRAAEFAGRLLPVPSSATLMHVTPERSLAQEQSGDVDRQFDAVRRALGYPVACEVVRRAGDPARELLRYARTTGVDLIVAGVNGRTYEDRSVRRNIGLALLLGAECSVLLFPE